jgi:uncharacterized phiE125 gp8 family phage protein
VSGIVVVTSASTAEPVTRTEAKLWLRIDEHTLDEDPLIDSLITRARQRWEDVTRRSAMIQAFDLYPEVELEDGCPITIPKAPLVSVTAIRGFADTEATDTGGTAMSTSGYYVDTAHEFGRVMTLSAFTYPTATREINPHIVSFTAGYSSGSSGVPEGVKTEIKQLIAVLYEHRGDEPEQMKALEAYGGAEYALPTWG